MYLSVAVELARDAVQRADRQVAGCHLHMTSLAIALDTFNYWTFR